MQASSAASSPGVASRSVHSLWAASFAVAVLLQLNDPDPALWCAAYGCAALFHLLCALRSSLAPPAACFAALPAALLLLSLHGLRATPLRQLLASPLRFEPAREALGMAIALVSIYAPGRVAVLGLFTLATAAWVGSGLGCI